MKKRNHPKKKEYTPEDVEKIRKRAGEIWRRKCQLLNTALDDWLQAERELKSKIGIKHKKPEEYTPDEVQKIRARAQEVRDEKIACLRTAFNDWIEAEKELQGELKGKIPPGDLFDLWFEKVSSNLTALLNAETPTQEMSGPDNVFSRSYIELMTECLN